MILFKTAHIKPVLSGRKTQTRRIWKKPHVRVGSLHKAKTQMLSKGYFALLRITGLRTEKLGDITEEDAKAEGGHTVKEFQQVWRDINGEWDPKIKVCVVEFEMVKR